MQNLMNDIRDGWSSIAGDMTFGNSLVASLMTGFVLAFDSRSCCGRRRCTGFKSIVSGGFNTKGGYDEGRGASKQVENYCEGRRYTGFKSIVSGGFNTKGGCDESRKV